jgi:hypothetical protein
MMQAYNTKRTCMPYNIKVKTPKLKNVCDRKLRLYCANVGAYPR